MEPETPHCCQTIIWLFLVDPLSYWHGTLSGFSVPMFSAATGEHACPGDPDMSSMTWMGTEHWGPQSHLHVYYCGGVLCCLQISTQTLVCWWTAARRTAGPQIMWQSMQPLSLSLSQLSSSHGWQVAYKPLEWTGFTADLLAWSVEDFGSYLNRKNLLSDFTNGSLYIYVDIDSSISTYIYIYRYL